MRIFLNGIGAFGFDVFTRLRERGEEVVAVAAPPKSLSGRPDRLYGAAEEAGIAVFDTTRLGEREVEAALKQQAPDLGVMAFVQEFISQAVLDLPAHGTIQYHPSLLPRHRGRSAINWAIIQGETTTGISIFWPDEGIDTGPVLLQREVEIGPDDTVGSLYRDKMYQPGIDMLVESIALVAAGKAPKLVQDESAVTYEKPAQGRLARIDWRRPLAEVYNLIRGCDPSPGAWTRLGDKRFALTDARPLAGVAGEPGVIGRIDADGIVVGTGDGAVIVRQLQVDDGRPAAAREVAAAEGIKVGARFLNPRVE
jgi:methionyl-tRNA formyltransferase